MGTGAAAGALALGTSRRARAADRVEITFASAKFFGKETLAEVVDAYNQAQSKVHVTYVELPPPSSSTEVHQALVQQLARRTGTPDVFTQDVVWIAEFAGAGWALPLGEYFDAKSQQEYFPGTIDACTFDGKLTALPWFVDSGMLYYRKDLLEGMPAPRCPRPGRDLTKTAQELQKSGKAEFGYSGRASRPRCWSATSSRVIASNSGAILAPDGKSSRLNDAQAVEAVQYLYDTINKHQDQPDRRAELGRGAVAAALHRGQGAPSCATGPTSTRSRRMPRPRTWSARSASRPCRISPAARARPASAATSTASMPRPRTGRPRSTS